MVHAASQMLHLSLLIRGFWSLSPAPGRARSFPALMHPFTTRATASLGAAPSFYPLCVF
jgi:hypothetical protein